MNPHVWKPHQSYSQNCLGFPFARLPFTPPAMPYINPLPYLLPSIQKSPTHSDPHAPPHPFCATALLRLQPPLAVTEDRPRRRRPHHHDHRRPLVLGHVSVGAADRWNTTIIVHVRTHRRPRSLLATLHHR
ncbi:hypothetical protein GUJ93_ZPchr0001g32534 [Zizania palustris]|uniref:Uncharacterized protein n=1 Tax=Zizania palustris TaxID=103762 RepID=A0A8J5VSL2_ZIZPA|nr:hypothetical protein GUJ93_ZPchr0001g32534 [Zizania palustris]